MEAINKLSFEIEDAELNYNFNSHENHEDKDNEGTFLSPDEALIDCINAYGIVDLQYMSRVSGLPVEALVATLNGKVIFQNLEFFKNLCKWYVTKG